MLKNLHSESVSVSETPPRPQTSGFQISLRFGRLHAPQSVLPSKRDFSDPPPVQHRPFGRTSREREGGSEPREAGFFQTDDAGQGGGSRKSLLLGRL